MSRCDREGGGSLARDWRAGTGCVTQQLLFLHVLLACSSAFAAEELSEYDSAGLFANKETAVVEG